MVKGVKEISIRILSVLLALIMVVTTQSVMMLEDVYSIMSAEAASGIEQGDPTDTEAELGEENYLPLTGIALVGSGIKSSEGNDVGENVATSLATILDIDVNTTPVTYYTTLDEAQNSNMSLIIYACGTAEAIGGTISAEIYEQTLMAEVRAMQAIAKNVILVTPGPVVAYGATGFYANNKDNANYTPSNTINGNNIYNRITDYAEVICNVAYECGEGVVSVLNNATLCGIDKYMQSSTDGIYPANYDKYVMWLAKYISENFVISKTTQTSTEEILSPIIINPEEGQDINTGKAFNVEWSKVAKAESYKVTIKKGETEVKVITTTTNSQIFPAGILKDTAENEAYTVTVEAIKDNIQSKQSTMITFIAHDTAPVSETSKKTNENISENKKVDVANAVIRDGAAYFNAQLTDGNIYNGTYQANTWINGINFAAVAPDSTAPVELIINLNQNKDESTAITNNNHLVNAINIGYAIDNNDNTIIPSSITVAVQKANENTWTTVGGKIYDEAQNTLHS